MEVLCTSETWYPPSRVHNITIWKTTLQIFTSAKPLIRHLKTYSQPCAHVHLATSSAATIAVCQVTKLATRWTTVVTSAMNLIAHVQMITSSVHLVSASMPVSAVIMNLTVQMQVMKCIVRVSIVCFFEMIIANLGCSFTFLLPSSFIKLKQHVQDKQKVMKTKYVIWLCHLSPYTVKPPFKLYLGSNELNMKLWQFIT